jgi:Protein of unknown function (DUF1326)
MYNVKGNFYEACDCEVICSCWAEVAPDMGTCTGIFVWSLDASSTINATDVAGCKVLFVSQGITCSVAQNIMVFIDAPATAQYDLIVQALAQPPWSNVVSAVGGVATPLRATINMPAGGAGQITVTNATASGAPYPVTVVANCTFNNVSLAGDPGTFAANAVGSALAKNITVGYVNTDANNDGLNLLLDTVAPAPPYTFDLDISGVTAMRGAYEYVNP